jgi:hypothetical protein
VTPSEQAAITTATMPESLQCLTMLASWEDLPVASCDRSATSFGTCGAATAHRGGAAVQQRCNTG